MSKQNKPELPAHLTYRIGETVVASLDTTKKRGFGLGERNPKTVGGENPQQGVDGQRKWDRRGRLARGIAWVGSKY